MIHSSNRVYDKLTSRVDIPDFALSKKSLNPLLGGSTNSYSSAMSSVESLRSGTQKTLKYASLVTLTVQNSALNLCMRLARIQKDLFISSTAVIMAEVIKLISCLVMVRLDEGLFEE